MRKAPRVAMNSAWNASSPTSLPFCANTTRPFSMASEPETSLFGLISTMASRRPLASVCTISLTGISRSVPITPVGSSSSSGASAKAICGGSEPNGGVST